MPHGVVSPDCPSVHCALTGTSAAWRHLSLELSNLGKPWTASIFFRLCPFYSRSGNPTPDLSPSRFSHHDICSFLDNTLLMTHLYFDPFTYPPPPVDTTRSILEYAPFILLRCDLMRAAHTSGSPIRTNGRRSAEGHSCRFRCSCFRPQSTISHDPANHRRTSLVADHANSRRDGKSLPRRRSVRSRDGTCKFGFSVKWDAHGFYITLKYSCGNSEHTQHAQIAEPQLIPMPSALMTKEEKESTCHVAKSSSTSSGRNYVFSRYGKFLSRLKVAYLLSKGQSKSSATDDIARMLDNFEKSDDIKFTTISDVPTSELRRLPPGHEDHPSVVLSTTKGENGNVISTDLSSVPAANGLVKQTRITRKSRKILANQYQFIGIAWIVLPLFRYFLLCPEVVWCDITSHSNNKGYHLLTFSCRTSLNRQVVFLWVWIPNEQRISFRWVFHIAIPKLLPESARKRVRLLMKDGDPQQRNEILSVIIDLFPGAREGGCGWHIGA